MPVEKTKGGRWKVRNVKGTHKTRGAAERQHRAVQASKARRRRRRK